MTEKADAQLLASPEGLAYVLLATPTELVFASVVGLMLVSIEVAVLLEFDVADAELLVVSLNVELLIVAFTGDAACWE